MFMQVNVSAHLFLSSTAYWIMLSTEIFSGSAGNAVTDGELAGCRKKYR